MSSVGLFASALWFIVGALLLLAAFRSRAASKRFETVARPATATVIGIEDDTSTYVDDDGVTRNVTSSVARVSFRTAEGREVVTTGGLGRSPTAPTAGASVEIRYDPANPSDIRLGPACSGAGAFGPLVGVALVMFLAGIVFAMAF
jgi:hypothetical protein